MTPRAARAALLKAFGVVPDARMVGFVGALNEQKRPLDFVDVARDVQSRLAVPVVFPMFGKGRLLKAAISAAISTAGMEVSLRRLGLRYPLQPWLAACDVLVAPAVNEGLGHAVVESMLAGIPVVARKSGGHEELITDGETGLFPATEDAPGFAAAVIALPQDTERAKAMAARARREALDRFEPRQLARRIAAVYDRLLGRNGIDLHAF